MTTEQTKVESTNEAKENAIHQKISTALLGLCTAGVIWMAKEMNSIDSRMSAVEAILHIQTSRQDAMEIRLNSTQLELSDIKGRLSIVEPKAQKQ